MTDPVGRKYTYVYDSTNINLLEMRQTRGSANELFAKVPPMVELHTYVYGAVPDDIVADTDFDSTDLYELGMVYL